jgi:hypothetical protein
MQRFGPWWRRGLGAVGFCGEKSLSDEGINCIGPDPWFLQAVSIQAKFLVFVEHFVAGVL